MPPRWPRAGGWRLPARGLGGWCARGRRAAGEAAGGEAARRRGGRLVPVRGFAAGPAVRFPAAPAVPGATGPAADQPGDDPELRRVAVALLRRIEAALRLPRHPDNTV